MRLLVCCKRDLPGCLFLNQLLPRLAGHEVSVWLSNVARPAESEVPQLAEIAFIERTLFVEHLFPLIDRLPDALQRGAELATFQGLAKRYQLAMEIVDEVNSAAAIAKLRSLAPELVVSARFSHVFKREAIAVPRHGIVNLHPGALPRFAGLFAPMRTVTAGYSELSGTLHWIDEGIDTGPLLALRSLPIDRKQSLLPQISAIYCQLIEPLLELVSSIAKGDCPSGTPQDRSQREYRSLPSGEDLAAFRATGMAFWKPAELGEWMRRFAPGEDAE